MRALYYVIIAFALISLLTGTQAMWVSNLGLRAVLSTGSFGDPQIGSYKGFVYTPGNPDAGNSGCNYVGYEDYGNISLSGNKSILTVVLSGLGGEGDVWIGLVIENSYDIATNLSNIDVSSAVDDGSVSVNGYYYYGPIHSPGNSPVWGGISACSLPPSGDTGTPIELSSSDKAVAWIHISFQGGTSDLTLSLRVQ